MNNNISPFYRASVHIKLPLLARGGMDKLQEVADRWQLQVTRVQVPPRAQVLTRGLLQVRGSAGEHSEAEGGKYDISNRERMGLTEFEAVQKMYDGVAEMIKMEQELEKEDHGEHHHHHHGHHGHHHHKHHKHHDHEHKDHDHDDQEKENDDE